MKNLEGVLKALSSGIYTSGEEIGQKLNVSRTTVWKNITSLKELGYKIDSSPRKGYRLDASPDTPLPFEIIPNLTTELLGRNILYFRELPSTNLKAKEMAEASDAEGTVVVADRQTAGRGRLGRTWSSPRGGVYLSIILRPKISPMDAPGLSHLITLALSMTLEDLYAVSPKIKWPNDVYLSSKKLSGVLLEMSSEADLIDYVIAGVGINANGDHGRLDEVSGTSLSLELRRSVSRVELISGFLNRFEVLYMKFQKQGLGCFIEDIKKRSFTLGRKVNVRVAERQIVGKAVELNPDGSLIVKRGNELIRVTSGDVAVVGEF